MAPNDSAKTTEDHTAPGAHRRRRMVRYVVPVAVGGLAAATIGLVPALASPGDPDLPKISAQKLIEKIAASDTEQLSGSVKITTDLGLPSLGALGGAAGGSDSSADPTAKLMELSSGTHTLRVAADGPDKQRVSIKEKASEYSLIHNAEQVWAYDSASNEAIHTTSPKAAEGAEKGHGQAPKEMPATPRDFADQALKAAQGTSSVTVDGTERIAGRDAYKLVIKPKQTGTTVGSVTVAVDGKTGTPLKFTLAPSGGGKAVVDVGFTDVDFAKPAASTFTFTPPKGAKVTQGDDHKAQEKQSPKGLDGAEGKNSLKDVKVIGTGWTSIAELRGTESGSKADGKSGADTGKGQQFLDALGTKVTGKFGSGTVFHTRLINALMTEDGSVYAGAVTKDALVDAANQAK
ncbi:outer membrane lipoprotein carrier protein LolA [Streptomyces sp. NPDC088725]|uniref:LolA family protein n=1 Tax=Streptomyces sp. NPDC088725 TaxID=3365873 RepID=UPI0038023D07